MISTMLSSIKAIKCYLTPMFEWFSAKHTIINTPSIMSIKENLSTKNSVFSQKVGLNISILFDQFFFIFWDRRIFFFFFTMLNKYIGMIQLKKMLNCNRGLNL
jgi:hypothetical protein